VLCTVGIKNTDIGDSIGQLVSEPVV